MIGRLVAWVAWWAALFWLWLLLAGDWNRTEVIGAACGAAVAASVAELMRAATKEPLAPPLDLLRASASLPFVIVADFAIVMYALARSLAQRRVVRGAFVTRGFDSGPKTTPRGTARRAWTTVLATYSPNAYVVDVDVDAQTVLIHDLVAWRRSEEPAA